MTPKTESTTPSTEPKAPDPTAVPEAYTFTAPEGYTISDKLVADLTPILKEAGIPQGVAQKLMDFHAAQMVAAAKAPADAVETMRTDWRAKVTADTEMKAAVNGDKTGLDAVKLDIGRALTHLPPALATDFKAAMDLTGAGDHPAFVKAMWKFSQLIGEGKHVNGAGPSPAGQKPPGAPERPSGAKAMFPNLP